MQPRRCAMARASRLWQPVFGSQSFRLIGGTCSCSFTSAGICWASIASCARSHLSSARSHHLTEHRVLGRGQTVWRCLVSWTSPGRRHSSQSAARRRTHLLMHNAKRRNPPTSYIQAPCTGTALPSLTPLPSLPSVPLPLPPVPLPLTLPCIRTVVYVACCIRAVACRVRPPATSCAY